LGSFRFNFSRQLIQIIYGAFVAGLDAGFIHNHWPLMNEGKLIHETVYIEQTPVIKILKVKVACNLYTEH